MKILSVVGARPNFVKIAPLLSEIRRYPEIVPILVHTGQHYDGPMSEQFFSDLEIQPPEFNLGVGSGSHAVQTAEVMRRLEPVLLDTRPDLVLVVGDVNSTLAGALTAVKVGIPVAHVEAGLRSFDRTMPEEINRLLTDAISDLLFVSEESGRENLLREGIAAEKIHFVGNVMIDTLLRVLPKAEERWPDLKRQFDLNRYALVTLHRPSNVDDPAALREVMTALAKLSQQIPVLFPVHPRTRLRIADIGLPVASCQLPASFKDAATCPLPVSSSSLPAASCQLKLLDPLGYLDFLALQAHAALVLTDSGGIQEETTFLGVPCLTFRQNTERPVTVTHGTNRVIGTNPSALAQEAFLALNDPPRQNGAPPLWDGKAAGRIVKILADHLQNGRTAEHSASSFELLSP